MKYSLLLTLSVFATVSLAAQVGQPATAVRPKAISAQKTVEIKNSFNYLMKDVNRLYDSVTALKKEMAKVSAQLNKKSKTEGLSANENLRIQILLSQFNNSETAAASIFKKMSDSASSLLRKL